MDDLLKWQVGFFVFLCIAIVVTALSYSTLHDAALFQKYQPAWDGLSNGSLMLEPSTAICSNNIGFSWSNTTTTSSNSYKSGTCSTTNTTCGRI